VKPDDPIFANLADGEHEAQVVMDIDIFNRQGPNPAITGRLLTKKQIVATAKWTLHPADAPTVRLNRDPTLREELQAGLRVRELEVWPIAHKPGFQIANLTMDPSPGRRGVLSVGVAFDVFLSSGDREWKLDHPIHFGPARVNSTWFASDATIEGLTADTVDIILRPNPSYAATTLDLFEIWDEEIRIRNVSVTPRKPGR
jgi:hypothetical protein